MTALLAAVRLLQSSIFHVADTCFAIVAPSPRRCAPSSRERKEREG